METTNSTSTKTAKYILLAIALLCLTGIVVVSIIRDKIVQNEMYQVSFTGKGTVYAKPDIAQVSLGIRTDRKVTAVAAVEENTKLMNQVIEKLKDEGIEDKDIKTTNYNLQPEYDYLPDTGRSEIKGYSVSQNVTVKIRELDKIGSIINVTTLAGVNQIGGIEFTIDDTDEIKKEAREEAVAKAKQKAEEMAELTGIKLGKLVSVYENEGAYYEPVYRNYALDSSVGYGGGGESLDIQPGQNELNLEVTLIYKVK